MKRQLAPSDPITEDVFRKPIIIGITGKKGTGKSTVSGYIVDNYDFTEFAFANSLKCACMEIFKLRSYQLFGTQADKERTDTYWNISPRLIMQEFGTAIRKIGEQQPELEKIWIRGMHREIELSNKHRIIISDIRYADELESIKEYEKKGWGVIIIKLTRLADDGADTHESEVQEIEADYLIENNGTRKELFNCVNCVLADYFQAIN